MLLIQLSLTSRHSRSAEFIVPSCTYCSSGTILQLSIFFTKQLRVSRPTVVNIIIIKKIKWIFFYLTDISHYCIFRVKFLTKWVIKGRTRVKQNKIEMMTAGTLTSSSRARGQIMVTFLCLIWSFSFGFVTDINIPS